MNVRALLIVIFLIVLSGCDKSSSGAEEMIGIFPKKNIDTALNYSREQNGNALLIWQDGELLIEEYEGNFNGNSFQLLFSGSKSFAGILAALGVRDGLFTFNTPIGEFIPEWDTESERGSVTIRELLNLTSGIETNPVGQAPAYDEWITSGMIFEKGSTFTYGPAPFIIFAYLFEQASAENALDYLDAELFTPLGVDRGLWFEIDNRPNFAFGATYRATDWLQIGIMLMNKGSLDGNTLIPVSIFNELITPSEAAPAYGITFWLNEIIDPQSSFVQRLPGTQGQISSLRLISDAAPPDLFMKSGALGQKLYMIPSLNMVILRFGKLPDNATGSEPPNLQDNFNDHEFFTRLFTGVDLQL